jgi:PhnB protein
MLSPDSNEATDELFAKLSAGGSEIDPLRIEMWGDYYGSLVDKFGVRWMFDVAQVN